MIKYTHTFSSLQLPMPLFFGFNLGIISISAYKLFNLSHFSWIILIILINYHFVDTLISFYIANFITLILIYISSSVIFTYYFLILELTTKLFYFCFVIECWLILTIVLCIGEVTILMCCFRIIFMIVKIGGL